MKRPEEVTLSRAEGEALISRLEGDALTAEDRRILVKVLTFYFWLLFGTLPVTLVDFRIALQFHFHHVC